MFGKLQFSIEQTHARIQRLNQEDHFESPQRPSTQLSGEQQYIENFEIPEQTVMREDDIEVYLRDQCWVSKCT